MENQELDKLKMQTMNEIAESNVLIGNMKAELVKLEEDRENFFKLRSDELVERLEKALDDSHEIVDKTISNYTLVQEFYQILTSYSVFIKESQTQLEEDANEFNLSAQKVVDKLNAREAQIDSDRKQIDAQLSFVKGEIDRMEIEKRQLTDDQRILRDGRESLKRAIERLKNQRV